MPSGREILVLKACEPILRDWPVAARIALRDALLADIARFSGEVWSYGETVIAVLYFKDCWDRGVRWPPTRTGSTVDGIAVLGDLVEAFGLEIALRILALESPAP